MPRMTGMPENRSTRSTVRPWAPGDAPDGHNSANSSAASPRCSICTNEATTKKKKIAKNTKKKNEKRYQLLKTPIKILLVGFALW